MLHVKSKGRKEEDVFFIRPAAGDTNSVSDLIRHRRQSERTVYSMKTNSPVLVQFCFTAPSFLLVSPGTCCTGCRCSAACPTRWRWRRSYPQSSCGGSHGNGRRRRRGWGGAGWEGCHSRCGEEEERDEGQSILRTENRKRKWSSFRHIQSQPGTQTTSDLSSATINILIYHFCLIMPTQNHNKA